MTTALTNEGQILLPDAIRERLRLSPGDDFEISIEDDDSITLRRVEIDSYPTLADFILACPEPFEIPPRDEENSAPIDL